MEKPVAGRYYVSLPAYMGKGVKIVTAQLVMVIVLQWTSNVAAEVQERVFGCLLEKQLQLNTRTWWGRTAAPIRRVHGVMRSFSSCNLGRHSWTALGCHVPTCIIVVWTVDRVPRFMFLHQTDTRKERHQCQRKQWPYSLLF